MRHPHFDGVAFKLCLLLATSPRGSGFFTGDVCQRFGGDRRFLWDRLRPAKKAGWITTEAIEGEKQHWISAGPALLELLGGDRP